MDKNEEGINIAIVIPDLTVEEATKAVEGIEWIQDEEISVTFHESIDKLMEDRGLVQNLDIIVTSQAGLNAISDECYNE